MCKTLTNCCLWRISGATHNNDGARTAGNVNFLRRRNSPPELPQ